MKLRIFTAIVLCLCVFFAFSVSAQTEENFEYIVGDVNLDEYVNSDDAIYLLQNILFSELYPINYKGSVDFTRDGNVNSDDAVYLLRHVMFPDIFPIASPAERMDAAVYLIDDTLFSKERYDGHGYELMHGWMVDDRGAQSVNKYASHNEFFSDSNNDSHVAIHRYITPLTDENAVLETKVYLKNAGDGFEIYFSDNGREVVKVFTENGFFGIESGEKTVGDASVFDGTAKIRLEMNLENKSARLYVNSVFVGQVDISTFDSLDKITFGTTDEGKLMFSPERTALYMNFIVNDTFMLSDTGITPQNYTVDGNVKTAFNNSGSTDSVSVLMSDNSSAERNFEALSGGFVSEIYLLQPALSGNAVITIGDAASVEMTGGEYLLDGEEIGTYNENIWQSIRFERDSDDNVTVRICGKDVYTFKCKGAVSSLKVENKNGTLWFDDVKCYNTYEFKDYVQAPVINNKNDDLTVCMSVCSLWHEGSHYGWDYVSPYDELMPLMGFYDEGLPETADWEIKYMVESGIDAIQPCWYASTANTPMKDPRLNKYAIHDGYFNAKYKEALDFCIMWENQGFKTNLTLETFKTHLWNYWVDWYFKDPNYMCLDNKPVLTIYQYETFMNCFSSADEAKKVIDFMREDIKQYGYDGIILLFSIYSAAQADSLDEVVLEDGVEIDGFLPYHWGINAYDPEYIKSQHQNGYTGKDDNVIVACANTGRNIIGWEQTRSPVATYEQHLETLEYLTEELLPIYENDFGKGSWQSNLLFLGTWNEYAEGHWLAPTGINGKGPGFDYINAWIKTFVKDDVTLTNPTEEQKKRISYMYPAITTPIRAELIDTEKKDVEDMTRVVSYLDFSVSDIMSNISYSRFDSLKIENGILYGKAESESTKKDPLFYSSNFKGVDTADVDIIHVRMKADVATTVNVYGSFDYDASITAEKSMTLRYTTPNKWQDLYFETKDYGFWKGKIDRLRFDLINTYGNFECDAIELLQKDESSTFGIIVDGARLDIHPQYIERRNDEIYLAALPSEGFYSASNIYYEWHRFDGKLYLKSGTVDNETSFVFTVGSDICLVNGEEKKLSESFGLFDAIPVIPVIFILENSGVDYQLKENALEIDIRSVDYSDCFGGEYNFDNSGDYMGFGMTKAIGFVYDGALHVIPKLQTNGGYDPIVVNASLDPVIYAEMCDSISVRMKYTLSDKSDDYATLYFITSKDDAFDEKKAVKLKLSSSEKDSEGYAVYTFPMSGNAYWAGTVTGIRFDPANADGEFVIDYIRINT